MIGAVLLTPRLLLRPLAGEDFEAYAALMAEPEQMEHLGGVVPREVAWRDLTLRAGAWITRGFSMFAVIERETGAFVGRVGPWQPEGWPGTEVGWGIAQAFVGKGYAYEAAAASMDYAVDVLGWHEVIHTIAPENIRSIRLAERLGSTNGGPTALPPPLAAHSVDRWSQTAKAWRQRRAVQAGTASAG